MRPPELQALGVMRPHGACDPGEICPYPPLSSLGYKGNLSRPYVTVSLVLLQIFIKTFTQKASVFLVYSFMQSICYAEAALNYLHR